MDHARTHNGSGQEHARANAAPVMIFRVGARQYGLPAGLVVRECMPVPELLPMAVMPPHVSGWFRLGAAMVVVLDLCVLLGERTQALSQPVDLLYRPLLLCSLPGGGQVALLVDMACEVAHPATVSPGMLDGGPQGAHATGQELELKDGSIAFMLHMSDILSRDERMRLDDLMERTRARAALWAADEGEGECRP
ncbi:hypothetical protein KSAC_11860 [Komagataeibacter saccharivorans]|uniref:chemotaxis protein CheW n=1 Tax=Komagataeibacter saccharivorans TaxID=265959 RepID=UPI001048DBEE|nr:chemotaxis protein CheW [Komagataeibacter saccharivorans]QBL93418.1 hypothetical protein KSAC_11860 [Komagataeibacter saccharivorans]